VGVRRLLPLADYRRQGVLHECRRLAEPAIGQDGQDGEALTMKDLCIS